MLSTTAIILTVVVAGIIIVAVGSILALKPPKQPDEDTSSGPTESSPDIALYKHYDKQYCVEESAYEATAVESTLTTTDRTEEKIIIALSKENEQPAFEVEKVELAPAPKVTKKPRAKKKTTTKSKKSK